METPHPKQAPVRLLQFHQGEGTKHNEHFAYCQHLKEIFQVVPDVIRADRERDFRLHIDAFRWAMTLMLYLTGSITLDGDLFTLKTWSSSQPQLLNCMPATKEGVSVSRKDLAGVL